MEEDKGRMKKIEAKDEELAKLAGPIKEKKQHFSKLNQGSEDQNLKGQ